MENYGYPYPPQFPPMRPLEGEYPDHGDGFGEYYGMGVLNEDREQGRRSRSKYRNRKTKVSKRSLSRTGSATKSRSRTRSRTRSQTHSKSQSRTHSRSRTRSRSRSRSGGRRNELNFKEPGFLDAFRVLYLTPSKHKKNPSKYLVTKKRQDRIEEILKSDQLGSKKWLFYPRPKNRNPEVDEAITSRHNCDQRVKVDGDFFRKYKKSKKVATDAPIAKLKRWELMLYKKLGFIQAV